MLKRMPAIAHVTREMVRKEEGDPLETGRGGV